MYNFYLYSLKQFNVFENLFQNFVNFSLKNIVFLCIGTKNYVNDNFGVLCGDELKKHKIFVYGSSVREINGTNFLNVYNFIKSKHKNAKIVVIDSVYCGGNKNPILIFQNTGVKVSAINKNNQPIGDAGILFNSFSYNNHEKNEVLNFLTNMINKMLKNQ